ncbi:MAG: Gfo/Idh/MocA family oxidoreductase [Candidatus Pacebacteria bacterium]|nr:Gfo/Idh/MocA family oxidoreductase [Candidatus Paceibacterota bacterium]MDP6659695.1 Gfo/Idh/MocA family oxidoreductase [Candidatus Paceibacterota bacterium]
MKRQLRVGIVGTGKMAKIRAEVMSGIEDVTMIAVAHGSPEADRTMRLVAFARQHGISDLDKWSIGDLEDAGLDALVVCSTAETHCDIIEEAAKAGVPYIFCEKPFGVAIPEIDRALIALDAHDAKLQVGFNRRFDPHFLELHEKVRGAVRHLEIVSLDPAPPSLENLTQDRALISETMVHDFDTALWFLGDGVDCISVRESCKNQDLKRAELYQIDAAVALLGFEDGETCTIRNHWGSPTGYRQEIRICDSNYEVWVTNSSDNGTSWLVGVCRMQSAALHKGFQDRYAESYVLEILAFLRSVREGGEISSGTAEQARQVAVLVDCARESAYLHGKSFNPLVQNHVAA